MTFTEAAIEVLRREGKPLHFKKIAEIAIREALLEHVGKVPDDTMADQLAAHCRLPHPDRRVIPVQTGTFALVEWGFDEDLAGLENLVEVPPEGELPYRGRERHPIPSREIARGAPRGEREGRRRREDEGPRQRRFPPPAEVAYEILAGAGRPLAVAEIAAQGAERLLMPEAFVRDAGSLSAALLEDNRRRESGGRHGLFQIEGDQVTLVSQPEPGERPAPSVALAATRPPATAAEARRAGLAALRRRLRECDGPTVEFVVCRALEKLGFHEVKVAKRGREHVTYTARRRMGIADVRHGIRILRGGEAGKRDVSELRRDLGLYGGQIGAVVTPGEAVREARTEATAPGQLPVLLLCGEALAELLVEAGVGCVPVIVPDLDEAFFRSAAEAAEKEEAARLARREERDRREGREPREGREERDGRDGREGRERREGREGRDARRGDERSEPRPGAAIVDGIQMTVDAPDSAVAVGVVITEVPAELEAEATPERSVAASAPFLEDEGDDVGDDGDEEDDAEGGDEGDAPTASDGTPAVRSEAGEPGATGERRRRRRRRRRRGGRGRGREGAPGTPGAPGEASAASPPSSVAAAASASDAPASEPAPGEPPQSGSGGGGAES
jgi:hypothetical protein